MTTLDLKEKWKKLSGQEVINGYKSLRISPDCIAEISLGVDIDKNHCLILSLPELHGVDFNSIKKEKISIEMYHKTNYLILTLHDSDYSDLFDDLIFSLYNVIKNISDPKVYAKDFILTFYRWSNFFEDKAIGRLSKDTIKGLFGEMLVLKLLVKKTNSSKVNDVLDSWKGPYDKGHDFVLDHKNIEVKTKNADKPTITISSEFQLENTKGKELELLVVSVEQDPIDGISIQDLFVEIKRLVIEMFGDISIVLKALSQKGLTTKNVYEYDNYRFIPIKFSVYNCLREDFPKLVRSNLVNAINNVRYDINLTDLDDYLTSEEDF